MKTRPLESHVMLAGLTRGLWISAAADRHLERREIYPDAGGTRRAPAAEAGPATSALQYPGEQPRVNVRTQTPRLR